MRNAVADSNKQFNVTLSPELKERLRRLAVEFKDEFQGQASKVGASIIKSYVEHWARLQERIRQGKMQVEKEIMENLERPPLLKGEAARTKNPTAGRKKRK